MRRRAACLAPAVALSVVLAASATAAAQQAAPEGEGNGFSLMEEGARLLFRGLVQEMVPALDEMGRTLRDLEPALRAMGPQLRELVALMGDVANYQMPERLPNGDILIRRKPGAPPPPFPGAPPGADTPQGEIEL